MWGLQGKNSLIMDKLLLPKNRHNKKLYFTHAAGWLAQVWKQVLFALRVSSEEAPKIQTVKSTVCASKKNKTFHGKALFATFHTPTHLFDTCAYHRFKFWSRSARFSDYLQIWNGQIGQNWLLFYFSSWEDCFTSWNSQFRLWVIALWEWGRNAKRLFYSSPHVCNNCGMLFCGKN